MGRPPTISRRQAVRAALDQIDEAGLDALSLDAVARRLGIRAPSLYHHFADRAELLSGVAKLILKGADVPELPIGANWRDALVEVSASTRRAILQHPNAAPLLLQTLPRAFMTPAYEYWVRHMAEGGVPPESWLPILDGLDKLTFGSVLLESAAITRRISYFSAIDPAVYPCLSEALEANRQDPERMFRTMVRAFLSGFAATEEDVPPPAALAR